jgi:MFS family permease
MSAISRRWLVLAGCFMGELTGPVLFAATFSVFFATLLDSETWSRTAIASAYSLYVLVYGLSGPLVGRWCERFGPKRVLLAGGIAIAAGFTVLGIVRQAWQFCAMYALLGVSAGMTGIVPLTTLVFRWFRTNTGLAIGIGSSGTVGGLFLAPLAYALIEHLGWRGAYPVLGVGGGLLLVGVVLAAVQDAPISPIQAFELEGDDSGLLQSHAEAIADESSLDDLSISQALATQRFWLLSASGFLFLAALTALLAHAVPLAQDRGMARGTGALALGLIVGLGPGGRVGLGYMADRFQAKRVLVMSFLLQAAALIILLASQAALLFWGFVVIFAVGHGGALAVAPVVMGKLFGRSSLAALVGIYWLIATAGGLLGPPLAAAMRQSVGSYSLVVTLLAISMLCAAGLVGIIREQVSPVRAPLIVSARRAIRPVI